MQRILVTGSSGLIGSEVCAYFHAKGWEVHGLDSNQRAVFFGPDGDTRWNEERLLRELRSYRHYELDVRNRNGVLDLFRAVRPHAVVHAAAQPSHAHAATIPFDDFDTNAVGTLNVLEATRQYCADAPFAHMSTNKVYGDAPNLIPLVETETRWDFADDRHVNGIAESFTIDQSRHSLFGASKVAADVMVQEYGSHFGMPTCCLRGGCLTGPNHSGVELHGFLSYLVKCNLEKRRYTIFGYKGKQVRDNIHSADVARFIDAFISAPRVAEVYNLGGGKGNSCSILEAFQLVEACSDIPMQWTYSDKHRDGDHICYYSDLAKMREHFPSWDISVSLPETIRQIVENWRARLS
ncbi:MAG: NAD-dependent epimerase/dehydratase family protein [Gemmatimonadota bacterium]